MMEMFSGVCSFVLLLWLSVRGRVFSSVVIVVIKIGWKCNM